MYHGFVVPICIIDDPNSTAVEVMFVPVRIPWDQHEVALLIDAYFRVEQGADLHQTATQLSQTLCGIASRSGRSIDDTYRNVNGMVMQLANVQYLFTDGEKGLSGASAMIRQMVELYKNDPVTYLTILKEAVRMSGNPLSVQDAFFAYAQGKIGLPPRLLEAYLQKAADYCHLKQPLLGITDVQEVRRIQQKVAKGKLLRFRYGKDAQPIRNVTQLYYNFVKSYRETKEQPVSRLGTQSVTEEELTQSAVEAINASSSSETGEVIQAANNRVDVNVETSDTVLVEETVSDDTVVSSDALWVDFSVDNSYLFTKPNLYIYKGDRHDAKSWNRLYVEVCGLLFVNYRDVFMTIMNGDIPGYNALAFADEQNCRRMRVPKGFAPGYYLESNVDATTIVRRIRGLHQLCKLGDDLRISYIRLNSREMVDGPKSSGEEWLLHELRAKGIRFADNRPVDGCLWIASDMSIPLSLKEAAERGYRIWLKQDGCRAFPNRPVLWTKDQPTTKEKSEIADNLEGFKQFLQEKQNLAERTANGYTSALRSVESYIRQNNLGVQLICDRADEAQKTIDLLMSRPDFVRLNQDRHYQYLAAMKQYVMFLEGATKGRVVAPDRHMTIIEAIYAVLRDCPVPLTAQQINDAIVKKGLYAFGTDNTLGVVRTIIYKHCMTTKERIERGEDVLIQTDGAGKKYYQIMDANTASIYLYGQGTTTPKVTDEPSEQSASPADDRWLPILADSFPDGYILDDFLSQFQASAFWQERYGEACPLHDAEIDSAMKAVGTVRDGRVFVRSEEDRQLIAQICAEITEILTQYTNVYRSCVYERYRDKLAEIGIYTESVMTQQILAEAQGAFISTYQVFALRGHETSVVEDCRKVLRDHGGAMHVDAVASILWFIPRDYVYHCMSLDDKALNIGNSTWMLAEHFPVTREDTEKIAHLLDEYFLTHNYVQAFDLVGLLRERLPSIADNLSSMTYQAVFHIVEYYLKDRFTFSKAIISPKGTTVDFISLFQGFAADREAFTLADLDAFASELKLPIYWESTYAGGAVRVSKTEFVNRSLIHFDVEATDRVLEDICPGDYLPLSAVSSAMMMHLPSCGYRWNGYLLLCYAHSFSKVFRLSYNSLGKTGFYGAMVRRSCKAISNYASLLERVLTDDGTWSTTEDALNLMVNQGYQAQRRFGGIDAIVEKARQNKLADGR